MHFTQLVSDYGSFIVAVMIGLECIGLPLPGETVLLAAAVFAGTTHNLGIASVIAAATGGAFVGNTVGYLVGRQFGYPLLLRYRSYLKLTDSRIKIGQYLFLHRGFLVIVVARFVAVLRSLAGILAGANRMPLHLFLIANAIGAAVWASFYGLIGYNLGDEAKKLIGPVGLGVGVVVIILLAAGVYYLARSESKLAEAAAREFPGPLPEPGKGWLQ